MRRPRLRFGLVPVAPSVRNAVAASVAIHVAVAALLLLALRSPHRAVTAEAPLDTRVNEPAIRFFEPVEPSVDVIVPAEKPSSSAPRPQVAETPTQPPLVRIAPQPSPLSPELQAILKRPGPVGDPVVEVPVRAAPRAPMAIAVRPAVPAVHGSLKPGQSIVYVLDASGSMGEAGKFAAARQALLATIQAQPESVRVQVVVYSSTASALLPGNRCVPMNARLIEQIERGLADREPAGRSDHAAGLRAALELRSDFVLIITDADDLSRAKFRNVMARFEPRAAICVANATATGLHEPRELR